MLIRYKILECATCKIENLLKTKQLENVPKKRGNTKPGEP